VWGGGERERGIDIDIHTPDDVNEVTAPPKDALAQKGVKGCVPCMYVCVYVCVYVRTYDSISKAARHLCMCTHVCMYVCMNKSVLVCVCVCVLLGEYCHGTYIKNCSTL
jgi:hypothetical protein